MRLAIAGIRPASDTEWDSIWRECPYATYFQSREWAHCWLEYTRGQTSPQPQLVSFSDGTRALLPLCCRTRARGRLRHYLLSPAGTYGGWISDNELGPGHARLLADHLCSRLNGASTWRLNPYEPHAGELHIAGVEPDSTQAISLTPGFDRIYRGWTKGHASAAKKARKAGITVREASSERDWEAYYQIYLESLKRWGDNATTRYRWQLFDALRRGSAGNVRLWLAEHDGRPVAGALCLYSRNHVVYWHGAALSEHFKLRPVHLLLYEVIKEACERGYAWFDMNPSGGLEGVRAFKKGFGARTLPAPVVRRRPLRYRVGSAAFRVLSRARNVVTLRSPLALVERAMLSRGCDTTQPQLFILGLPRSGTTLVYQYIVHRARVAYLTNGVARFPRAACTISSLQHRFLGRYRSDFQSRYGKARGGNAPREAGSFWARCFGLDGYVSARTADPESAERLRRTVACVQRVFGDVPFVNKNVKHLLRIDALARIFPHSVFLIVERPHPDVALSVLRARHALLEDPDAWWSVKPPDYASLKDRPRIQQIAGQLRSLADRLETDLAGLPARRVLRVDFERFCSEPEQLFDRIDTVLGGLEQRNPPVAPFRPHTAAARTEEEQELVALMSGQPRPAPAPASCESDSALSDPA